MSYARQNDKMMDDGWDIGTCIGVRKCGLFFDKVLRIPFLLQDVLIAGFLGNITYMPFAESASISQSAFCDLLNLQILARTEFVQRDIFCV